ncbi:MAG: hypothetical protein ACLSA6_11390 [Holdemania massiliensis]
MSWHVEQALLAGKSETALGTEYLDPSLMQLMRTASRSGEVQPLLEGYVEVRQGQLLSQLRFMARTAAVCIHNDCRDDFDRLSDPASAAFHHESDVALGKEN